MSIHNAKHGIFKSIISKSTIILGLMSGISFGNNNYYDIKLNNEYSHYTQSSIEDYLLNSLGELSDEFTCNMHTNSSRCDADEINIYDTVIIKNIKFDTRFGNVTLNNIYKTDKIEYHNILRQYRDLLPRKFECKDYTTKISNEVFNNSLTCYFNARFYDMNIKITTKDKSQGLPKGLRPIDYATQYSSMDSLTNDDMGALNSSSIKIDKIMIEIIKKDGFNQLTAPLDYQDVGGAFGYALGYINANNEINNSTKQELTKVLTGIKDFVIKDSNVRRIVFSITDKLPRYYSLAALKYALSDISMTNVPEVLVDIVKLANEYRLEVGEFRYKRRSY